MLERLTPPPRLTVSEWADANRILSAETSSEPGQYRTSKAEYLRGIMDAVTDPAVSEIWVKKSAQVGFTEVLNNVIGYFVHQDPAPMLMVRPNLEDAESWSKERLAPMVRDTPVLQGLFAEAKARDSSNTLRLKQFPGGYLAVAGANAPAGLASRAVRIVVFDEVDKFPATAGTEGDPIALGKKRATTFWNRKFLMGSTPAVKGTSRIEEGFEGSDQRYYLVPCPHCSERQRLVWPNVRWPDGRPDLACYVCAHCGAEIYEAHKAAMVAAGEWHATRPSVGIAGFHLSELYSPWSTWAEMAVRFVEAKKLPTTLQEFINQALGEAWEDGYSQIDAEGLEARREAYTAQTLPPGVVLLTRGTDVQDDRLESTVWGWGKDGECWRVEHDVLRGSPGASGSDSVWADHDALLSRGYLTEDGRPLVVEACGVDSGGHFTEEVYAYCHRRRRRRVWAVKGIAGRGRVAWPKKASRGGKLRRDVWLVGVDTIKDTLYGRLKHAKEPGPGYVHLDAGADKGYLEQLVSEKVVYKQVASRRVKYWVPRTTDIAQEGLDCWVYAYAVMIGRGGERLLAARDGRRLATLPSAMAVARAASMLPADVGDAEQHPTAAGEIEQPEAAAEDVAADPFRQPRASAPSAPARKPAFQRPRRNWIKHW